jgi:uncharacterized damage-inducible protein DinB
MKDSILIKSSGIILERDLKKVIHEINQYKDDKSLWSTYGEINNSSGNLALHIAGAVHHFIGSVLGKNGYIRNREREFNDKNIEKAVIIDQLNKAIEVVIEMLGKLTDEDIEKEFPEKPGGNSMTIGFFLIHFISHINYHLGQINYNRRILFPEETQ